MCCAATPLNPNLERNAKREYSYGAGHIQPQAAVDPGLVYDNTVQDHVLLLCRLGHSNSSLVKEITGSAYICPDEQLLPRLRDFNYPSILVQSLKDTVRVTRTVTNVGPIGSYYSVSVEPPEGVGMIVEPQTLFFTEEGQKLSFNVTFAASGLGDNYVGFGSLTWKNTYFHHSVRSPVVIANSQFRRAW